MDGQSLGEGEEGDGRGWRAQRRWEREMEERGCGSKVDRSDGGRIKQDGFPCMVVFVAREENKEADLKPKASSKPLPTLSACPSGCVCERERGRFQL